MAAFGGLPMRRGSTVPSSDPSLFAFSSARENKRKLSYQSLTPNKFGKTHTSSRRHDPQSVPLKPTRSAPGISLSPARDSRTSPSDQISQRGSLAVQKLQRRHSTAVVDLSAKTSRLLQTLQPSHNRRRSLSLPLGAQISSLLPGDTTVSSEAVKPGATSSGRERDHLSVPPALSRSASPQAARGQSTSTEDNMAASAVLSLQAGGHMWSNPHDLKSPLNFTFITDEISGQQKAQVPATMELYEHPRQFFSPPMHNAVPLAFFANGNDAVRTVENSTDVSVGSVPLSSVPSNAGSTSATVPVALPRIMTLEEAKTQDGFNPSAFDELLLSASQSLNSESSDRNPQPMHQTLSQASHPLHQQLHAQQQPKAEEINYDAFFQQQAFEQQSRPQVWPVHQPVSDTALILRFHRLMYVRCSPATRCKISSDSRSPRSADTP